MRILLLAVLMSAVGLSAVNPVTAQSCELISDPLEYVCCRTPACETPLPLGLPREGEAP